MFSARRRTRSSVTSPTIRAAASTFASTAPTTARAPPASGAKTLRRELCCAFAVGCLHGGTPRGAEKIAACWADARKIPQIVFKPDWTRHAKAAPFKRNDQLLEALPIGVVAFPGSGVTDNLADKARKLGIPPFDFRKAA